MHVVRSFLAGSLLLLSANADAGGPARGQGGRKQPTAVVDKLVGGRVVSRTVVVGSLGRKTGKKEVSFEQQVGAMKKGWSVTQEDAEMPADLTLGGRLEETGFREQAGKRGQSIIRLERKGAHHLEGEQETRVFAGGKLTRIKKLSRTQGGDDAVGRFAAGRAAAGQRGTGRPVREEIGNESYVMGSRGWEPYAGLAFRYDAANPYEVTFEAGRGKNWPLDREELMTALETGRGGRGDAVMMVRDAWLHIQLSGVDPDSGNAVTARLRMPKAAVERFLQRTLASVPRGTEASHVDLDAEIRKLLGE